MIFKWIHSGEDWRKLFLGHTKSPCELPCNVFHTRTKFISSVRDNKRTKFMVKLFFIPEMAITITDFVKPTLSTLLSEVWTELHGLNMTCMTCTAYMTQNRSTWFNPNVSQVGGSMGLWLGLSVIQAIQILAKVTPQFKYLTKWI